MPRTARIVLPHHPHHIVHRGHNRNNVFFLEHDYKFYLNKLVDLKEELSCKLYAYCLMTNHVHLIVDPCAEGKSLSELIKRLACLHTRRVNKIRSRSGTLWEGRFKSSPIQSEKYLHACSRYIELNPVRAGVVAAPEDYPWSSCRAKTGRVELEWLDEDVCYRQLGKTRLERGRKYRNMVCSALTEKEMKKIRHAVNRGGVMGDETFIKAYSLELDRYAGPRGPGRPRKGVCPT